jgi:uncharacterized protein YjbJ (UPF0337 family)
MKDDPTNDKDLKKRSAADQVKGKAKQVAGEVQKKGNQILKGLGHARLIFTDTPRH